MATSRRHRAQLNIRWLWSMRRLPPPRTGRRGHRRRYATRMRCYRFGGDTEAQTVTPTAWVSSCRWRPCFTARIDGWSRDRLSHRPVPLRVAGHGLRGSSAALAVVASPIRSPPARWGGRRNPAQEPHPRHAPGSGETRSKAWAWWEPDPFACRHEEEENQIQEKTRSTRLTPGGENHSHRLCAKRTRTPTTPKPPENRAFQPPLTVL